MFRLTLPDKVCLHVELNGTGRPLVLLHGFTGCAANWQAHAEQFASQFTTVRIDLLGHGGSDSPADPELYQMARCVEDLAAVFDHLGLEQAAVLGYSMGGRVALHLAAAYPERVGALILESASPGLADPAERAARVISDEALATRIEHEGLEAFVDYWEHLPLFASQSGLPEATRAALRTQRLQNNSIGLANSLRGLGVGAQPSLWAQLPTLQIPTLLIAGALDEKFMAIAQQMAAVMPAAKWVSVPNAGHSVHLERPAEFERVVLDWLSEIGD